jgi:hypothetical protein
VYRARNVECLTYVQKCLILGNCEFQLTPTYNPMPGGIINLNSMNAWVLVNQAIGKPDNIKFGVKIGLGL